MKERKREPKRRMRERACVYLDIKLTVCAEHPGELTNLGLSCDL